MQLDPKSWGPYFWRTIHFTAMGYPNRPSALDKQRYKSFYTNLHHVLPCETCAVNYQRHIHQELPIDGHLNSSAQLFAWTVALHNLVNKEIGKRSDWTVEEARSALLRDDQDPSRLYKAALYRVIAVTTTFVALFVLSKTCLSASTTKTKAKTLAITIIAAVTLELFRMLLGYILRHPEK